MTTTERRLKAVRFFDELYEIIYQAAPGDPQSATILYEVWATAIQTKGRKGITPAVLSRIHHLPQETARRRLNKMVAEGYLLKRDGQYYLLSMSAYQRAFDKFVTLLESYGNEN